MTVKEMGTKRLVPGVVLSGGLGACPEAGRYLTMAVSFQMSQWCHVTLTAPYHCTWIHCNMVMVPSVTSLLSKPHDKTICAAGARPLAVNARDINRALKALNMDLCQVGTIVDVAPQR